MLSIPNLRSIEYKIDSVVVCSLVERVMQKAIEAFFTDPTCDLYLEARDAVVDDSSFRVAYADMLRLTTLMRAGRMSEAQVELDWLLPSWALSPRIHGFGARLAQYFHDGEDVELFRFMRNACLEGLCASGCGTEETPYVILYPTDALDLIQSIGEVALKQSHCCSDPSLDEFECQSGLKVVFSHAIERAPSATVGV
jgi:hypothetical protein